MWRWGRGVGCWSAGAWLPSTGKKRHQRGNGWQPPPPLSLCLYLSHPVTAVDCRGRGVISAGRVMDGCNMCDRICVCARGRRDGKRVKVQMRSFIISIQSKEENTSTDDAVQHLKKKKRLLLITYQTLSGQTHSLSSPHSPHETAYL